MSSSRRSSVLLSLTVLIAVWQCWDLYSADPNLLFSVICIVAGYATMAFSLRIGACRVISLALARLPVWICIFFGYNVGFFRASLLGGDFGSVHSPGFPCIGSFHWHHWLQSLIALDVTFIVFALIAKGRVAVARNISILVGFSLIGTIYYLGLVFPESQSLIHISLAYSVYFFGLAWTIKERGQINFQLVAAIWLGVMLGIHVNGLTGLFLDLKRHQIPSALIFFNSAECKVP